MTEGLRFAPCPKVQKVQSEGKSFMTITWTTHGVWHDPRPLRVFPLHDGDGTGRGSRGSY